MITFGKSPKQAADEITHIMSLPIYKHYGKVVAMVCVLIAASLFLTVSVTHAHSIIPARLVILGLGFGATATFNVKDAGTCNATISVSSNDTSIATVTPAIIFSDDAKFTVQAEGPGKTTISIGWVGEDFPETPCNENTNGLTRSISVEVIDPISMSNNDNSASAKDPISTYTGELFFTESRDLNLGGPMPLYFQRYFASKLRMGFVEGDLGDNWRHNFEWVLHWVGNYVVFVTERGKALKYTNDGAGDWTLNTATGSPFELMQDGQEMWVKDPSTEFIYKFNALGQLAEIHDGKGNIHTLVYSAGTFGNKLSKVEYDTGGSIRRLLFSYITINSIDKISLVREEFDLTSGRSVSFTYGNPADSPTDPYYPYYIVGYTDAAGNWTKYDYKDTSSTADRGLLLRKIEPEGNIPYEQTYYGTAAQYVSGRVETQIDSSGNTTTFTYNSSSSTTMTGPDSDTWTHLHDADGSLESSTDQAGNVTTIGNDGNKRRTSVLDKESGSRSMAYTGSGKLSTVANENADATSYSYSTRTHATSGLGFEDLAGISYQDGTSETFLYDSAGNLTSHTDRAGNTSTYTYNTLGQRSTATNPAGGMTTYNYNTWGDMTSVIDNAGNTIQYAYDSLHRLSTITRPDTTTRNTTYDDLNTVLSKIKTITNENGNDVTMTYDANGNLLTVGNALGNTVTYTYDGNNRIATIVDPLGNTITRTYDKLERLKTQQDPLLNTTTFNFDSRGRLVSLLDPGGNTWSSGYNNNGLATSGTNPASNAKTFAYDALGNTTSVTSPEGNKTTYTYDSDRRIKSVTDPLTNTTNYDFDANGNITGITLPGGTGAAVYTRNSLGLITNVADPNNNNWSYTYDAQGKLTSSADPLNNQTTYVYDNRNRISVVTYPGGGTQAITYDGVNNVTRRLFSDTTDQSYSYDAAERLTVATNISFTYDANGRITDSNGIGATYDSMGRVATLTLAVGKIITYVYNNLGQPITVTDWVGGSTTFTYDAAGRMLTMTRPNGVTTTNTYDTDGRIADITEGTLSSISFTRDGNGNVTEATRSLPLEPTLADSTSNLSFDASSQVSGYTYDGMGRLINDGTRAYTWDLASRLTGYTEGATTVNFTYDAFGGVFTRTENVTVRQFTWNYTLSMMPVVSVLKENGADLRYFVHTPMGTLLYSVEAGDNSRQFYHFDGTGNTLFLTADNGTVTNSYAHTPYGVQTDSTGSFDSLFTYGGKFGVMKEGSSGLYYMWQRFYDSGTMRFISRDPIKGRLYPHSINPYQYAVGNPVTYIDPLGANPTAGDALNAGKEIDGAIGGAAGIAGHYMGEAAEHADELADVLGRALPANATPKDINIVTKVTKNADKLAKSTKALNAAGNVGTVLQVVSIAQEGIRLKDAFDRVNKEYGERISNAWQTYFNQLQAAMELYKKKKWTEMQLRKFIIKIKWSLDLELHRAGFDRGTDAWLNLMVGVKNMAATFVPVPFLSDIISPESKYPGVH